jgi:hypothetical protein
MKKISKSVILLVFIVSIFILDVFNKEQTYSWNIYLPVIKIFKFIWFLFFLTSIIVDRKYKSVLNLSVLLVIFLLGQFSRMKFNHEFSVGDFFNASREFILLCYPLVFYYYLNSLNYAELKDSLVKVIKALIIVVVVTTIVGFLFSIPFFRTYNSRFGYMGLLPKSITASYFYISAMLFAYYLVLYENAKKALLILTIVASLLVGTKAIYLFLLILFIYHFISQKVYLKKEFYIFAFAFFTIVFVAYDKWKHMLEATFVNLYRIFKRDGFMTAVTSYRNLKFVSNVDAYLSQWKWFNYLVGGRVAECPLFEMSVLDLLVNLGLIGSIYYLRLFYKLALNAQKKNESILLFSFGSILIVSIFAGQFFSNFSAISYTIIIIYLIRSSLNNRIKNEI